jgi:hypothetical protein
MKVVGNLQLLPEKKMPLYFCDFSWVTLPRAEKEDARHGHVYIIVSNKCTTARHFLGLISQCIDFHQSQRTVYCTDSSC